MLQVVGQNPLISPNTYKLVVKIELRGIGPPGRQFIIYCCTRQSCKRAD